ncbi:MAG TPA: hypothetical protein VJQ52_04470 [Steroidobacteraceae bacterium]|nr:hypothetical protein [Steroidobacteraceae bacterium]
MKRATQLAAAVSLLLGVAAAQAADQDWQFRASVYGYFPSIGGESNFPAGGGEIDIAADDLIENSKLVGMAAFEAQRGRWGAFVDLIYMDIGDSVSGSSTLGAGQVALPPGITADASLDITAWVLTTAANFRALETSQSSFDVFAGLRLLDAQSDLGWSFNVDLSPLGGPPQRGSAEMADNKVDAIAGVKGRYQLGADGRWFIPYYLDAGAGDSDLTWQAALGIGYSLKHGEVFAAYRHLDYDFGNAGAIGNLEFDGPALGLAYRW